MRTFESFVFESSQQIAKQDKHGGSIVTQLLLEISQNPVGAKAHTFLITYGFIVTVRLLLLTCKLQRTLWQFLIFFNLLAGS